MTIEFGHIAKKLRMRTEAGQTTVVHVDAWGTGPFVIVTGGKTFRFEDSDQFGPSLIGKRGDILQAQPSPKSPFWLAHRIWRRTDRPTEEDGITCIIAELKPTKIRMLNRRNAIILEDGDEDGPILIEGRDF